MEDKINDVNDTIDSVKDQSKITEKALLSKIDDLSAKLSEFENKFENYKNDLKIEGKDQMSDYIPIPSQEIDLTAKTPSIHEVSEEYHTNYEYKGKKGQVPGKNPNYECDWMSGIEFEKPEYGKPRMFTMNQIKDLVFLHLSRSELKRKVEKNKNLVAYHDDQIFEQGRSQKKLRNELTERIVKADGGISEINENIDTITKDYNKRFTNINRSLDLNDKKIFILKENSDDAKKFHEMMNGKTDRLNGRIISFKENLDKQVKELETLVFQKITVLVDHSANEFTRLDKDMQRNK